MQKGKVKTAIETLSQLCPGKSATYYFALTMTQSKAIEYLKCDEEFNLMMGVLTAAEAQAYD